MLERCVVIFLLTTKVVDLVYGCPGNCSCVGGAAGGSELTVDCQRRPDVDEHQLSRQLDSLLSGNLTYGRLTSLSIVNSPLRHVPRSVCRLTTLTSLRLDRNRLTALPKDCLDNLTQVAWLSANDNLIESLPDGLFDGLTKLFSLQLARNRIRSIGLRVFSDPTKLTRVRFIQLTSNELTSLEPWPYVRGLLGSQLSRVTVYLDRNRISNFTNRMQQNFTCSGTVSYFTLNLIKNRIRHVLDMTTGWNISLSDVVCLLHFRNGRPVMKVKMAGDSYACDCVDFDLYKLGQSFPFAFGDASSSHCNSTDPLIGMLPISRVPLERFTCEIREDCPESCHCVYRPANATLHVYCSRSNLTRLPAKLPKLKKSYTRYKLDFSHNPLSTLEPRDFFNRTSILDASNCEVETLDMRTLRSLAPVMEVLLNGNRLSVLPLAITATNQTMPRLTLSDNPWKCSCGNRWMSPWLRSVNDSLTNANDVLCSSPTRLRGKSILGMTGEEFCVDPAKKATKISLLSVAAVTAAVLLVGIAVYRLRVQLYTRWKLHPFDRDECHGEDMHYDVFLCCSSEDNDPHGMRILELIESEGYRVCFEPRDFPVGEALAENICNAVIHSKRTVCLLTENFLESSFCMSAFETSYGHSVVAKRKRRLIVLMALDRRSPSLYSGDASDKATLRHFLDHFAYIDYAGDANGDWLDELLYALPLRGMKDEPDRQGRNDDAAALLSAAE